MTHYSLGCNLIPNLDRVKTLAEPAIRYRVKPVGVRIKKSPAPPTFDPPAFIDGEDDDDNEGKNFYGLKLLVIFVICISAIILRLRRSIIRDGRWIDRIDDGAAILIQSR